MSWIDTVLSGESETGRFDPAFTFIVLLGILSLFADMTYESAWSIAGPYLGVLGASAIVVGFVAGAGEFIGYALRLLAGYVSDRTGNYWTPTFIGYGLNLLVVPLLAFAGRWEVAAILLVVERAGKAIRTPTHDAMVSHASDKAGAGIGFGVHEALDQTGAVVGALVVAAILWTTNEYRLAFGVLAIPAVLAILVLVVTRRRYPSSTRFVPDVESGQNGTVQTSSTFWLYLLASGLIAAGFADFALIAYHFEGSGLMAAHTVPLLYAVAMGVDAFVAPGLGRLYDQYGTSTLIGATLLSTLFAPLVFLGGFWVAVAGMAVWGLGMSARESLMRATVARLMAAESRGLSYGVFDSGYGLAWFLGSAVMGLLYDVSLLYLVAFSVVSQLLALPLLVLVKRRLT